MRTLETPLGQDVRVFALTSAGFGRDQICTQGGARFFNHLATQHNSTQVDRTSFVAQDQARSAEMAVVLFVCFLISTLKVNESVRTFNLRIHVPNATVVTPLGIR